MSKIKTLSIGDIHGKTDWMYWTHGSPVNFQSWAIAVENGADPYDSLWHEEYKNYTSYDKIIFIGDYVDSFTVSNIEMKKNLEDIIFFKKALPDKVVLLLGNHDIQYIVEDYICSGHRPVMKYDFYQIFTENLNLFQIAYQIKNVLWTHAGVTLGWLRVLNKEMFDPNHRFYQVTQQAKDWKFGDQINLAWNYRMKSLYNVDKDSGGCSTWAGPLWVRPRTLNEKAPKSLRQIVGHTPVNSIKQEGNITYIDCLEHGDGGDCYALDI
jgi:predicted MPP superfamily phosphohydrolase